MLSKAEHKLKTISTPLHMLVFLCVLRWLIAASRACSAMLKACVSDGSQAGREHVRAKRAVWLPVCFRAVTESINQLITLCTQQAAGQKECDNALRELEVAGPSQTLYHTQTLSVAYLSVFHQRKLLLVIGHLAFSFWLLPEG